MLKPTVTALLLYTLPALAAVPDRITRPVDPAQVRTVAGNVHRLAAPQYDKGPVDAGMRMDYIQLMTSPTPAQQQDLDRLLAAQQNPSSPQFHKWLTPEEFGNRFGLSAADHAKVAAWLKSEGFTIHEMAKGRNWIAFSGTAAQVSKSFHTEIHRYEVKGETHYANATAPSVPEALADITGGILGLNDFQLRSMAQQAPLYTTGGNHYLAPEDFQTIYDVAPLYQQSGLDGTGVKIAIVGQSDVVLSDLQAFKKRYNLPVNDPQMINYSGVDPGYNGAELEGNLDLEWSSAIAPKATIYYVYGSNAISAMIYAVNVNLAQIVSISYGACEIDYAQSYYRSIAQQGNAEGITILASSGDSGAAGCDPQGVYPFAEGGETVDFPAVMPEVTAVGGTQFAEGSGTYWSATNSANFGSALSYIPETAWNESGTSGLFASGGGTSAVYARPLWQTGPGVPADSARHVPDVALSSASHDAYEVYYLGSNTAVYGTSCAAPSMAGIVALLNQFQVKSGYQTAPGLGNINPQLYRLAQSAPYVFHDVTVGDNVVPCRQGSPSCSSGSYGYPAGLTYDMVTGLGSVDANVFVGQWNLSTRSTTVNVTTSSAKVTVNDTITLTASVAPATGTGSPTGTVAFSFSSLPLGTATVAPNGTANVTFPAYLIGTGTYSLTAEYSGDAAFTGSGATVKVQITVPATGAASILPSWPNTVWPNLPDAEGLSWVTTLSLNETAGVAAVLTGFTIDGQSQPLAQYFPNVNILPRGSISSTFVLRNQAAPLVHTYGFTGIDAGGNSWSRQVSVNYNSLPDTESFLITATPSVVVQDSTAIPSCQWPVQIHLDDMGATGSLNLVTALYLGDVNMASQIDSIFGTTRLDAFGSISGRICFGGITPPATETIEYVAGGVAGQMTVTFAGPPSNPAIITANPASLTLNATAGGTSASAMLSVGLSDKTQVWSASIYPANRTTSWLSVSQPTGTGPAQISLMANGAGFEPGVYRANIVLQCINAIPQSVTVPVMLVLGGSTTGTKITGIGNAATFQNSAAAGMMLTVVGTNLANGTLVTPAVSPLPYSSAGVSATVNGIAAPVTYVSPTQVNLQIPYSAGAGPAVLGINNNGQIAGYAFNVANAAPGIFTDGSGNVIPKATATVGSVATLYFNGGGEVTPALKTAYWEPSTVAMTSLPKPILPLTVTVGGTPAFLQFYGLPSGFLGTTQVNFTVPALTPGTYPVVVTVGGIASPAAMLTVTPATVSQ